VSSKPVSLRRRHLMIASLAGAAAPAVALAQQHTERGAHPAAIGMSIARGDALLVSGRVVDGAGKPLAGSKVELLQHGVAGATDGDGRFVLSTTAGKTSRGVLCRVSHGERSHVAYLTFARRHRSEREGIAVLDRDDRGTWRTTCGLTVA
jgi:hypothetical protein